VGKETIKKNGLGGKPPKLMPRSIPYASKNRKREKARKRDLSQKEGKERSTKGEKKQEQRGGGERRGLGLAEFKFSWVSRGEKKKKSRPSAGAEWGEKEKRNSTGGYKLLMSELGKSKPGGPQHGQISLYLMGTRLGGRGQTVK